MLYKSQTKIKYNYIFFILLSLFFCIISDKCIDENCENCSADGSFCFYCKNNSIKFPYKCYKKEKKLKIASLCKMWLWMQSKKWYLNFHIKIYIICSLWTNLFKFFYIRYVEYLFYYPNHLYISFLWLIIIITVGTFLYCLTHKTSAKFYNINSFLRFRPFNEVIILFLLI